MSIAAEASKRQSLPPRHTLTYNRIDDHISQTSIDTPRFKSFTLLRSVRRQSEQLANDYIRYARNVRRIRQQLLFNHRCKDLTSLTEIYVSKMARYKFEVSVLNAGGRGSKMEFEKV